MTKPTKFIVSSEGTNNRLDLFLSAELKISRSQAQKLISQGLITRNGQLPKKAGDRVKTGDNIEVLSKQGTQGSMPTKMRYSATTELSKTERLKDSKINATIKIIKRTKEYLVIEKPTGLLTHPTQANETNAVSSILLKKYPELRTVGDSQSKIINLKSKIIRPGIVHRLDKEASGLMVVARTQPMFENLKDQFKNRTVAKEYFALVHGRVAKDWDEINFPIARSETYDRMAARPLRHDLSPALSSAEARDRHNPSFAKEGAGGGLADDHISPSKEARTEFEVVQRLINFTLLKVTLHTGRMHQIRVHLLAYNHPLVGDPLYKQTKRPTKWDDKCGRLFLHSTKLSFTDLKGKRQTFESALPKELEEFLKLLK